MPGSGEYAAAGAKATGAGVLAPMTWMATPRPASAAARADKVTMVRLWNFFM
ncbi:hypothetical protein D3C72_2139220 [compost metagenome]